MPPHRDAPIGCRHHARGAGRAGPHDGHIEIAASDSVTAQITRDEVLPFGYKLQNHESARMWVQRPNRLRMEVAGDIKNRTYVYDGSKMTCSRRTPTCIPSPAPAAIGETGRQAAGCRRRDAADRHAVPRPDWQPHRGRPGRHRRRRDQMDGVPTDHLAFRQPDVDWQLWVTKGAQALPTKDADHDPLRVGRSAVPGDPALGPENRASTRKPSRSSRRRARQGFRYRAELRHLREVAK